MQDISTQDSSNDILVDNFGRRVNYVRISVTDRCDFRCVYCMDEDMEFVPREQLLTLEELATVARAFTELGVSKIRITGGEPLVRRNVMQLFEQIGALPGLGELVMTTNGSQLPRYAEQLKAAGMKRLNISLDSLDPERFRRLTRVGELDKVLAGIDAARAAGFERTKINAVILKNRNHDEVTDLVRFASDRGMDLSFIEEMPLGAIGEHDRYEAYYSSDQIRADLEETFTLLPTTETTGGPSKYFQLAETGTRVGFISPHSHNFCDTCNRVRLTCEGRLLLCLGQEHSVDLRRVLRANPGDIEPVKQAIRDSMAIKPKGHDFNLQEKPVIFRHMNMTGG
ncbi:cyclic pyranopterin phosphate synthase [Methylohalomonas lacus]|uniref:GTP 3',8-cyclase n=1 Tax=Methylohalomonas lacus TaxID=398773 RepID=A0AAE3L0I9_9GAMM|nr:GTP 3',8-cyclase MoaA [Methylohalomonas lacus]MCS3902604.1 cyclic pyranopterin phosphate synthase [Methylohalomonas lacus]